MGGRAELFDDMIPYEMITLLNERLFCFPFFVFILLLIDLFGVLDL